MILQRSCTGEEEEDIIICGGGRKNKFLIKNIQEIKINSPVKLIDDLGVDGDFIESQAFAYLAIRSYLKFTYFFS